MQWSCHLASWLPNWIWIFSRCHPASNSKNKDGQQVQGEKKYSPFVILILWLIFHWKVFLTFLTFLYFSAPNRIWRYHLNPHHLASNRNQCLWDETMVSSHFFHIFQEFIYFFYQKSSPHHINSTSLIFTCLLHLYLLLPSYLELSAYWGGRLKRRERQWWIMLLGFCFEELFLMLGCMVCYWFLLSMVVKTAVLKYCNHPSKRPGVRLAAGSVCIFVLNLSYFLWNSFRSNFTCIFGGYFFVL